MTVTGAADAGWRAAKLPALCAGAGMLLRRAALREMLREVPAADADALGLTR